MSMKEKNPLSKMKVFFIIWIGQFISIIGSGLTGFALGVWVYLETGSVTQLSLIFVSFAIPRILMSPIAGALVDRWDRRHVMILSDSGAAVSTLMIALLLYSNQLQIWHIYILVGISSAFHSFQWPAYSAATSLLVPKEHLGRTAGMVQAAEAVSTIVSPALAGFLIMTIEIWDILFIDFATFLFALCTLMIVRVPKPKTTADGEAGKSSLLNEAAFGWRYIRARHGLFSLLIFFAVVNFTLGFVSVLITPLVLSFASPVILGSMISVGGFGMLIGGLVMSTWGGPKRRINGLLGSIFIGGVVLGLGGFRDSVLLISAVYFVFLFMVPIANGCSQAIWQVKTAPDVQGRVFSVRQMVAMSMSPLSYVLAGPLADKVFEPLMVVNGPLAQSVGRIIGVGPGRGIGLIFILVGMSMAIATIASYLYPRLRLLEDELPDMIGEE